MGFFSSAFNVAKNIGKAAVRGAQTVGKVYDKAKNYYTTGKNFLTNLPVVGEVASNLINRGESFLKNKLQEKTGLTADDVDSRIQEARGMVKDIGEALDR